MTSRRSLCSLLAGSAIFASAELLSRPANANGLLACPFCGNSKAPGIFSDKELIGPHGDSWFAVCCNTQEGGCGAKSAYDPTPEMARDEWNKRIT